jgi:hypothetical protein
LLDNGLQVIEIAGPADELLGDGNVAPLLVLLEVYAQVAIGHSQAIAWFGKGQETMTSRPRSGGRA